MAKPGREKTLGAELSSAFHEKASQELERLREMVAENLKEEMIRFDIWWHGKNFGICMEQVGGLISDVGERFDIVEMDDLTLTGSGKVWCLVFVYV